MRTEGEHMQDRIGFALHDMAEAFVGDMISPIKTHPDIAGPFGIIEETEHLKICHALGVNPSWSKSITVKRYDNIMLAAEIYEVATITDPNYPYSHDQHSRAAELIATGECNGKKAFFKEWDILKQRQLAT